MLQDLESARVPDMNAPDVLRALDLLRWQKIIGLCLGLLLAVNVYLLQHKASVIAFYFCTGFQVVLVLALGLLFREMRALFKRLL
jgi:hypothetical protein